MRKHDGQIDVPRDIALVTCRGLAKMYDLRFPLTSLRLMSEFDGDDARSVEANNTSGFNCRLKTGSSTELSSHSYGRAIDVNPLWNPMVITGKALPTGSEAYRVATDRSRTRQDVAGLWGEAGVLFGDDPISAHFRAAGWLWGGRWRSVHDYQHLSQTGR